MSDRKFDITSGGFINTNGGIGTDDEGNILTRVGDNMFMDEDGDLHITSSGFNDDDDD